MCEISDSESFVSYAFGEGGFFVAGLGGGCHPKLKRSFIPGLAVEEEPFSLSTEIPAFVSWLVSVSPGFAAGKKEQCHREAVSHSQKVRRFVPVYISSKLLSFLLP